MCPCFFPLVIITYYVVLNNLILYSTVKLKPHPSPLSSPSVWVCKGTTIRDTSTPREMHLATLWKQITIHCRSSRSYNQPLQFLVQDLYATNHDLNRQDPNLRLRHVGQDLYIWYRRTDPTQETSCMC